MVRCELDKNSIFNLLNNKSCKAAFVIFLFYKNMQAGFVDFQIRKKLSKTAFPQCTIQHVVSSF